MMNKISIIIPHYNTPQLLLRCLDSIPDREDIQIIVVDDNSSPKIVDFDNFPGLERQNVQVLFNKNNKGAGHARNIALKEATGKWLLFADSDDFFVSGFLDTLSYHFNSEHDMILFKAESVDSETLEHTERNERINKNIDLALNNDITAREASLNVQSPWCRLIRREFVEQNAIIFDEVMASNDTMFTTKASCLAKSIGLSPEIIYVVTYRKGSLWDSRKTNPNNYLTRLNVQIDRNKFVKQYGYKQLPLLSYLYHAYEINLSTFFKVFWILISRGVLFQGIFTYFRQ